MKICSKCNAENEDLAVFCRVCKDTFIHGKETVSEEAAKPVATFCENCGEKLINGAVFCRKCGTRVGMLDAPVLNVQARPVQTEMPRPVLNVQIPAFQVPVQTEVERPVQSVQIPEFGDFEEEKTICYAPRKAILESYINSNKNRQQNYNQSQFVESYPEAQPVGSGFDTAESQPEAVGYASAESQPEAGGYVSAESQPEAGGHATAESQPEANEQYVDDYEPEYSEKYEPGYEPEKNQQNVDSYEPEYSDQYEPEYSDQYEPEYSDQYETEYSDQYETEYSDQYETEYSDQYESGYETEYSDPYNQGYDYQYAEGGYQNEYGAPGEFLGEKKSGKKVVILVIVLVFIAVAAAGVCFLLLGGSDKSHKVGENGNTYEQGIIESQDMGMNGGNESYVDDTFLDSTSGSNNLPDAPASSEEFPMENSTDFVLPDSATRYLSMEELAGLTSDQTRIARNEIYARHGRMFTDEGLQAYFNGMSWYQPSIAPDDFSDSLLNEFEIANRDLIVEYEKQQGYR